MPLRECENEFKTAFFAVAGKDGASVGFNGVEDNGQAESRATGFSGATAVDSVELVKQMFKRFVGNAVAVVIE